MSGELAEEASEDWGYGEDDCQDDNMWEQKNGVMISIDDMNISHIRNTVRMLRRNDKAYLIPSKMIQRLKRDKDD